MKALKILCGILAALTMLSGLCGFAGVENGEAAVVFDSVSGVPGQTVEMNVHLTKNPGTTGLRFAVSYDRDKLTLESAEYTQLGGGGLIAVNTANEPFVLLWNVATYEFTETGVLARLKFKIDEAASVGDIPLSVSYRKGDCIDFNLKDIAMNITEGNVKVLYDGSNCEHTSTETKTVKEPGCSELGKYENVCKACSTVVSDGNIPYKEHSYGEYETKKQPTATEDGYREKTCGACSNTVREVIAALGGADTTQTDVSDTPVTTPSSNTSDTTALDTSDIPNDTEAVDTTEQSIVTQKPDDSDSNGISSVALSSDSEGGEATKPSDIDTNNIPSAADGTSQTTGAVSSNGTLTYPDTEGTGEDEDITAAETVVLCVIIAVAVAMLAALIIWKIKRKNKMLGKNE